MTIIEILNYLNSSVKTSVSGAVKAIQSSVLRVKFPEVQKIKGKVDVQFPQTQKVEVKFPEVQKINGEVKVTNTVSLNGIEEKLESIKKELSDKGIEVKNFPEFPKEIKITNFPSEKEINFVGLESKLDVLISSIKKLPTKFPDYKLPVYPEQKAINFPKSLTVDNLEGLKSDNPKEYVPVRLTDGKEFYKAIEEFYQQVASSVTFTNSEHQKTSALVDKNRNMVTVVSDKYGLNNVEKIGDTTYTGSEDCDGNFLITKVIKTNATVEMTYATNRNNTIIPSYNYAWQHKTSINYNIYSLSF